MERQKLLDMYQLLGWHTMHIEPGGKAPARRLSSLAGDKALTYNYLDQAPHNVYTHHISKKDDLTADMNLAVLPQGSLLLVVDCDVKGEYDGIKVFQEICDELGVDLSTTPKVTTPSGGAHYYFKGRCADLPKGHWAPGVEVYQSHYVLAPPSVTSSGVYTWEILPTQGRLKKVPYRLFERIVADRASYRVSRKSGHANQPTQRISLSEYLTNGFGARGDRHYAAMSLAGRLAKQKYRREVATRFMKAVYDNTEQSGRFMSWREVERCIEYAYTATPETTGGVHVSSDWMSQ